jgi:hypothetical protein
MCNKKKRDKKQTLPSVFKDSHSDSERRLKNPPVEQGSPISGDKAER